MPGGPAVEVRKSHDSATWYNATVLDIGADTVRVQFEDEVWPTRDVPIEQVRLRPLPGSSSAFDPAVEEVVEVSIAATEANPSGWSRGRIKKIKNKVFYFVAFEGSQRSTQDIIVEKDGLRRLNSSPPIDPATLCRRTISVDRSLHGWLRSQDSSGCLNDVAARTSLLVASCTSTRPDAKGPPRVLLVGDERAVYLAEKLLLEIHFKHQIKMQGFHEHRERYLERIKEYEAQYGSWHKEVFTVDGSFVGKIIGSKGANISRLRTEFEVDITIEDDEHSGKWESKVTVTGPSAESVRKAREQMEYVTAKIEIEPDQVGWIVGKGYQNLHDIQSKAELQYARYDDKSSSIELCGLRSQVEDAKLMVSVHRDYLTVYEDMSNERRTIQQQFAELDRKDGKGYGKRGDKGSWGKGKGKSGGSSGGKGKYALADWDEGRDGDEPAPPPLRGSGRGGGGGGGKDWKGGRKGRGK